MKRNIEEQIFVNIQEKFKTSFNMPENLNQKQPTTETQFENYAILKLYQ